LSPSKETVCGLPLALSLTETVPKLKELDGGIHLTVMVQDFPAPISGNSHNRSDVAAWD